MQNLKIIYFSIKIKNSINFTRQCYIGDILKHACSSTHCTNEWGGFWGKFNTRDFHYLCSLILLWWIFYYHKRESKKIPNIRACLSQQCHEHDVVFAWTKFPPARFNIKLRIWNFLPVLVLIFFLLHWNKRRKSWLSLKCRGESSFQFLKQQLASHKWISTH